MPVQFLSEAEHKSLNHFLSEISSEDVNRFFLLSDKELTILKQLRAEHNRLGFAIPHPHHVWNETHNLKARESSLFSS